MRRCALESHKKMMNLFSRAAVLTLAATLTAAASAQSVNTLDPVLRAQVDRIAAQVLEKTGVPSASLAVVKGGKLVYTQAYGKARLAEGNTPALAATPSMRYSIGSISKQFTAAALLMLQEEGKLKLDDTVEKYLPGLTRGSEVTLRQLLSHTSGYQDYWPEDYAMTPMLQPASSQFIVDKWAKKPLDFEPGTQWQYSNTNFVIAGLVIEKASGKPYFDFLTERIFRPLGMKSVWNSDQVKLTSPDAGSYIRFGLGPLHPAPKEGAGWMAAAGELAMTPHDLALWDESLLSRSLLKAESYKEMFTEVKLKDGSGSHYGLGVEVTKRSGRNSIEHSGEVSGFVSDNIVLIDDGVAVAVTTNQDAVSAASAIARLTAPIIAAIPPNPYEAQAIALYRGLQKGELDRSLLAPNLNDYFTKQAVEDFKNSLGPLGEPLSLRQTGEELRGGMTFRGFEILYPGKKLELTTYTYPDGKLEQYIVAPAN